MIPNRCHTQPKYHSLFTYFVQLAEVKGKYDNMFKVEKKDMKAVFEKILQIARLGQGESSVTKGSSKEAWSSKDQPLSKESMAPESFEEPV